MWRAFWRTLHRQKLLDHDFLGHHADEVGVYQPKLIIPLRVVAIQQQPRQMITRAHRHALHPGIVVGQHRQAQAVAPLNGFASQGQHAGVRPLGMSAESLEQVGVVTACQTAVSCDKHIAAALPPTGGDVGNAGVVAAGHGRRYSGGGDAGVGLAVFHALLGAAQFGGRHKLHGLGDLHGAFHASDAQLDVFHGRSGHGETSLLIFCF